MMHSSSLKELKDETFAPRSLGLVETTGHVAGENLAAAGWSKFLERKPASHAENKAWNGEHWKVQGWAVETGRLRPWEHIELEATWPRGPSLPFSVFSFLVFSLLCPASPPSPLFPVSPRFVPPSPPFCSLSQRTARPPAHQQRILFDPFTFSSEQFP